MGWYVMKEVALSLPFSIDLYGAISATSEQPKIWQDRVRAVIGTNIRERVMKPDFGTSISTSFMETQEEAESSIKQEVQTAFANFLSPLYLNSVTTIFDEYEGSVNVSVNYNLPNNQTEITTVAVVYVLGTLPPYEENI
jgi:phage baseplate assembly protein W